METEGYQSSGSSNVTVSASGTGTIDNLSISNSRAESKIHLAGNEMLLTLPSNNLLGTKLVQIFDISGKRLFSSSIESDNDQLRISNVKLPAGAFYASIQDESNRSIIPFVKGK
jgi:hypothetical protein